MRLSLILLKKSIYAHTSTPPKGVVIKSIYPTKMLFESNISSKKLSNGIMRRFLGEWSSKAYLCNIMRLSLIRYKEIYLS